MSLQPVMCFFDSENMFETLKSIDTKEEMTDVLGTPIRIKALTPILTVREGERIPKQYVVYNGYKGRISPHSIHPLGMITNTGDGTDGTLRLRIDPEPDKSNWLKSSTGKEIGVSAGALIAILLHSSSLARLPDEKYSDVPMVQIGIHHRDGIYIGWLKEKYIQRFYRQ